MKHLTEHLLQLRQNVKALWHLSKIAELALYALPGRCRGAALAKLKLKTQRGVLGCSLSYCCFVYHLIHTA